MVLATSHHHKQTAAGRKRLGQHHKQTRHYTKTYWPYLPMLLVVVAGLILNATWNNGKGVLGYATDVGPVTLLQETNQQRSQNGQSALTLNNQLTEAAQAKANDMIQKDYWAHVSPDGKQPWQFIAESGYEYVTAGENLAYGFNTGPAVIAGWMNRPGHRANILNTSYQEVGFGIANASNYQNSGEETVVVAMYAKPQSIAAPTVAQNQPTPTAPLTSKAEPAAKPVTVQPQPTVAAEPTTSEVVKNPSPTAKQVTQEPQTSNLPAARRVARIDVMTNGNAQWAALVLSTVASLCTIWFVVRHGRLWRRYIIRGESFIIKHPVFDTALLALGVIGFVLTRSSGFIH